VVGRHETAPEALAVGDGVESFNGVPTEQCDREASSLEHGAFMKN
jgi:hypothetical protein